MRPTFCLSTGTVLLTSLLAVPAQAELSMTMTGASDYDFRGISQTEGAGALQLSVDYAAAAFYASAWSSAVDFGSGVDGDREVDLTAGVSRETAAGLQWDFGASAYLYPSATGRVGDPLDPDDDIAATPDYLELFIGIAGERVGARYWYSPSLYDTGETASYLETSVTFALRQNLKLCLHAGYSFGNYFAALETVGGDDAEYFDFSIGLERSVSRFDLAFKYVWTEVEPEFMVSTGALRSDARWILSVGTTFTLPSRDRTR
jgi:uncharacterized protein (TIGR02001 family)